MKTETVWLQRPGEDVPWGFRLQGGVDKGSPLTVCRVSPGSIASTGVSVGDVILKVGEADTANLTHDQAQYYIKAAGNLLQLHIRKSLTGVKMTVGGGGTTSPSVLSPQPDKYANRLSEQLANMEMHNTPTSPTPYGTQPDYSSPSGGYQDFNNEPSYDNYSNANYTNDNYNADSYNNQYNSYNDQPPAPMSPQINSAVPQAPPLPSQMPSYNRSQPTPPPAMPDAVLNMAAKGGPEKKPWAYAPDADMLKEHRDRVRRRRPSGGPDITQSAVYKMIHGLDEQPPTAAPPQRQASEGFRSPRRQPSVDDETSFSGVNRGDTYDHIPSRAFQRLQSLTGGGEVDRSSIMPNVTGVAAKPTRRNLRRAESAPGPHEDDQDGGVDLSYVGGHIPSKTFRMLQQSVGADPADYDTGVSNGMEEPMVVAPSDSQSHPGDPHAAARERRRRRRRGSLPRRMSPSPQRRPVLPREPPHEARRDEFDEASYLAGRIPIVRSEDEVKDNPVVMSGRPSRNKAAWEKEATPEREFDENAFLAGKVNIINDPDSETNLPPRAPRKKEFSAKPDWARTVDRKKRERAFERSTSQVADDRQREQEKAARQYIDVEEVPTKPRNFDERAYLSGNVAIFDDKPVAPRPMVIAADGYSQEPARPKVYEFQKIAQRRASIDFVDPLAKAEYAARMMEAAEDDKPLDDNEPFDEHAFLEGQLPIVSGEAKPRAPREPKVFKEVPAWAKRVSQDHEQPADEGNFNERAFLHGQIPMVKGGTPDLRPVNRPRKKKPKKPVEEAPPEDQEPFDEKAFLAGRVPILGGATESALPPREPKKQVERHLAPWERKQREDDIYIPPTNEFDEKDFLQGKVPVITGDTERQLPMRQALPPRPIRRPVVEEMPKAPWEKFRPSAAEEDDSNQNQRIPSKTFIRLSRSVSRDAPAEAGESDFEPKSPKPHLKVLRSSRPRKPKYDRSRSLSPGEAARRQKELQEGTTKDVPLNDMAYKGTNIPSKSFMRLQSHVDKPDEVKIDPLDRLRPKKASRPDESIDPEKALEQMSIQEHSPEKYFDALEQVVKDSDKSGPQVNGVDASEAKPTPAAPAPAPAPAPAAPKQAQPVKQVEPKSPSSGIKIINLSSPQPKSDDMPTFAEGEDQVTDF